VLLPLAEQLLLHLPLPADRRGVAPFGDDGGALIEAAKRTSTVVLMPDVADGAVLVALCTAGDDERAWLRLEASSDAGQRVAAVVWDAAAPPLHERALQAALGAAHVNSLSLQRFRSDLRARIARGWRATAMHDVARFDGVTQCWNALLEHRAELADQLVAKCEAAAQRALAAALEPATQPDGTLRIPINAVLLER